MSLAIPLIMLVHFVEASSFLDFMEGISFRFEFSGSCRLFDESRTKYVTHFVGQCSNPIFDSNVASHFGFVDPTDTPWHFRTKNRMETRFGYPF